MSKRIRTDKVSNDQKSASHAKKLKIFSGAHTDFESMLQAHAFFKVNNKELCDDLVQETFIKTWVYLANEGKIHLMKPFLYHVLNCLIIDEYRKQKPFSLDLLLENGYEPEAQKTSRIIDVYDGALAAELIEKLPLTYRKIMYMRYMRELSVSEVSLITGMSKNAVAVKAFRGLEKLRILYKHEGE